MRTLSLKSTTSLVLCLSLATPGFAQQAETPFPCVTGNGETVENGNQFARALIVGLTNPGPAVSAESADLQACDMQALTQATESGGDELALALATASDEVKTRLLPQDDADATVAAEGATETEMTAEVDAGSDTADVADTDAPSAEAGADVEAQNENAQDTLADTAEAPVEEQAAPDEAIAEAAAADKAAEAAVPEDETAEERAEIAEEQTADDAQVTDGAAQAATEPAEPEAVAEPAEATAPAEPAAPAEATADTPAAEAATETAVEPVEPVAPAAETPDDAAAAEPETDVAPSTDAVTTNDAAASDGTAADDAAAAAAIAAQANSGEATTQAEPDEAQSADTAAQSDIEADTSAETSTPPAADPEADQAVTAESEGDATTQTPQLTAEERAARAQERSAARQASAAALAAEGEAASSPEVVTEDVSQDDIRAADQDFETAVAGTANSETTATAEAESNDDDGASSFEKALLLGLGAVAVGALLNNGDKVVSNSGDRVVVQRDGELRVLKNDDVLLRQAGAEVGTQTFEDGSTLTTITREDGSVVTTIRAADGTVLRRSLTRADGTQVALIDDLAELQPVEIASLPPVPQEVPVDTVALNDQAALQAALTANLLAQTNRSYSLEQVRDIRQVRALAPQIELAAITFETGSAAIQPSQAEELSALGGAIREIIANDPSTVFLVEGHTDAVGDAGYNLALSDRRAETVALALSQYFSVPPENLVTQGYGESFLKVSTQTEERANRRAAVRNITQLLQNS